MRKVAGYLLGSGVIVVKEQRGSPPPATRQEVMNANGTSIAPYFKLVAVCCWGPFSARRHLPRRVRIHKQTREGRHAGRHVAAICSPWGKLSLYDQLGANNRHYIRLIMVTGPRYTSLDFR